MIYTIASTDTHCNEYNQHLTIEKIGNKYAVYLTGDEMPHVYTSRTFDTLMDAYKVYEKISSWFIFGCYSFDDRREYLMTGTMK